MDGHCAAFSHLIIKMMYDVQYSVQMYRYCNCIMVQIFDLSNFAEFCDPSKPCEKVESSKNKEAYG